jgi:hypothetical protein
MVRAVRFIRDQNTCVLSVFSVRELREVAVRDTEELSVQLLQPSRVLQFNKIVFHSMANLIEYVQLLANLNLRSLHL